MQTYCNFELIISDNGSTDSTEEICLEYAKSDQRVSYFRNAKNIGMHSNFNRVFELSRGKYFMWAAADDYWKPTYVEKCVGKLEKYPTAVLCYGLVQFVDAVGDLYILPGFPDTIGHVARDTIDLNIIDRVFSASWFLYGMYRSEFIKKTRLLTQTLMSDLVFGLEISLVGDLIKVDEHLMSYRITGGRSIEEILDLLTITEIEKSKIRLAPYTQAAKDLMNVITISCVDEVIKEELRGLLAEHLVKIFPAIADENKISGNTLVEFIRSME